MVSREFGNNKVLNKKKNIAVWLSQLSNHSGFRRYAGNTLWLFSEKFLRIFLDLAITVWVIRYLGPEQFGVLSYAISFVGLFSAIATVGLDNILVRALVNDQSRYESLLGSAFGLRLIGAICVFCLISISIQFGGNSRDEKILIYIVASSILFQTLNVINLYFRSKVLSKYVVLASTIGLAFTSIIKIFLILNHASIFAFSAVIIFDSFVVAITLIYFYTRDVSAFHVGNTRLATFKWKFEVKLAKSLFRDSWPLMLSGLVVAIYMKIDQVMIKEMIDSTAVGQYAVAVKLSELWYFIPVAITGSVFPALVRAKNTNNQIYLQRLTYLYTFMFWVAFMLAVGISFLGEWIIKVLFGDPYIHASGVLIIHIWTGVFVFLGVASHQWLVTENLQLYSLINTCVGAALNIALNLYLIPIYGIQGAAVASLISYFIAAYFMLLFSKKTRPNFFAISKSINIFKVLYAEK